MSEKKLVGLKLPVYCRNRLISVILGGIGGFLILHPHTMLVYALVHLHEGRGLHLHLRELISQPLAAFRPVMLPMVISFILFGGVIGLLVSIAMGRRKRLLATRDEHEKKKIALETMKELMATLSHHLLNANMVIGGRARAVAKITTDEKILEDLRVINEKQETNVPGVYAAGDICGPPWQVAKAVGQGCIAGLEAAAYTKKI